MSVDADRNSWNRAGTVACVVIGLVVFVPVGLIGLGFALDYYSDHERARLRVVVDTEMLSAGFSPPIPYATSYPRRPDFSVPSPDAKWTFTAEWVDTRGYNWGIKNTQTGKSYFRTENIQPNSAFDPQVGAIWSPDGRYVAITWRSGGDCDYVEVVHIDGNEPHHTELPTYDAVTPDRDLLKGPDVGRLEGLGGTRSEALRWQNGSDLAEIVYISVQMKDGTERDIGVHQVLRFHDRSYTVGSRSYDFYETLPEVF